MNNVRNIISDSRIRLHDKEHDDFPFDRLATEDVSDVVGAGIWDEVNLQVEDCVGFPVHILLLRRRRNKHNSTLQQ